MNYRHAYHAGNFADVMKHIVLIRVLAYMQRKDAGFAYLDTHGGLGRYDLSSEESKRTGEWQCGVGRLLGQATAPEQLSVLLSPYMEAIKQHVDGGMLVSYPGSPRIAHAMRRPQDRLSIMELHPDDYRQLSNEFSGAHGVKTYHLDGWTALKSQLPPKEKRGVILIDPPYESSDEFDRIIIGLSAALKRFATGVYCVWYPLKRDDQVARFHESLGALKQETLICELTISVATKSDQTPHLYGSGMAIINPPYVLSDEVSVLLDWLVPLLEIEPGSGRGHVRYLS